MVNALAIGREVVRFEDGAKRICLWKLVSNKLV